jgi:carbonic anhydrase
MSAAGRNGVALGDVPTTYCQSAQVREGPPPGTVLVTCTEPCLDRGLLRRVQTGPVAVLRRPGAAVVPYPWADDAADWRHFLDVLKVRDVVVCGHTRCGCLPPPRAAEVRVGGVYHRVRQAAGSCARAQADVLAQVRHLKSYPAVKAAIGRGALRLHAWVYLDETGMVVAHAGPGDGFVPLAEARPIPMGFARLVRATAIM